MSNSGSARSEAPVVALLGGSFDPVHSAHLALADAARLHGAEQVRWIPAAQSPFKPEGPCIDDADRLALLQAAIQDRPGESIDLREWQREGPSYTIETLRDLVAEQPATRWAWLMGEDSLADFLDWREAEQILALAELWVARREEGGASRIEERASRLQQAVPTARIEHIPFAPQPARSTELRALLAQGIDPGRELVPATVLHEIVARGLYGWPRQSD